MPASSAPGDDTPDPNAVYLDPWGPGLLPLLEQLNTPEMTAHLGGPETPEKLADRQGRYERLADSGAGRMFVIVLISTGEAVGSVGYWEREWRGERVYETGWGVLPAFQGRGIAKAATREAISWARNDQKRRFLHAFPGVENPPSNALCRALGFILLDECEFEYPPGHLMRCNDWRLDLFAGS